MYAAAQTGLAARAARLLAFLALLLGLLGMHGLASSHHAGAAAPAAHGGTVAEPASDSQPHAPHAAPAPGLGVVVVVEPFCDADCPTGLAMLCLAVLASAALAAGLARLRGLLAPPTRSGRRPGPAPPDRLPRTPDAVSELCVSRT